MSALSWKMLHLKLCPAVLLASTPEMKCKPGAPPAPEQMTRKQSAEIEGLQRDDPFSLDSIKLQGLLHPVDRNALSYVS